jgi:hypothetical protein
MIKIVKDCNRELAADAGTGTAATPVANTAEDMSGI